MRISILFFYILWVFLCCWFTTSAKDKGKHGVTLELISAETIT